MELSIILNFILILVIAIRQIRMERKMGELVPPKEDVHSKTMDNVETSKVVVHYEPLDNVEEVDNVKWGIIDEHLCLLWDGEIVLYIDKDTKNIHASDFFVDYDSDNNRYYKSLNDLFKKFK